MNRGTRATHTVSLRINARCRSTIEHLLQKLIDDTPAARRELLAYALFYAYLSIRLPECPLSPDPAELSSLEAGQKRYVALGDGIFIFDFSPPALRPRGTLCDALRSPHGSVYLFTQPHLSEAWTSRANAWPITIRNRLDVRTVPSWICMGIAMMAVYCRAASRICFKRLIDRMNRCLLSFPDANLQVVTKISPEPFSRTDSSRLKSALIIHPIRS